MTIRVLAIENPDITNPREGELPYYMMFVPVDIEAGETLQIKSSMGEFHNGDRFYVLETEIESPETDDVIYVVYPYSRDVAGRFNIMNRSMALLTKAFGGSFDGQAYDYDEGTCVLLRNPHKEAMEALLHGPAFGIH